MPQFKNLGAVGRSYDEGRFHQSLLYRSGAPTMALAGRWGDLSVGGGTPKYNAYVGGQTEATQLVGSSNNGLFTGAYAGAKNLAEISIYSPAAATFVLCDYLMFYPLIDGDSVDEQVMDNPVTLPRYTTGEGVQMALISSITGATTGTVRVNYTNSAGVAKVTSNYGVAATNPGVLCTSGNSIAGNQAPFIPLNSGDKGVRSVESLTFISPPSGFYTLLLFKPLTTVVVPENAQTAEKTFIQMHMGLPEIQPGAYLNYLFNTQTATSIVGTRALHTFIW